MKHKKILITAQSFGYGPASKAITVACIIKEKCSDIIIDFIGEKSALTFATANAHIFDQIVPLTNYFDIAIRLDNVNYNAVVSVMEPFTVAYAAKRGKRVHFIDSLYWFWDRGEKIESLEYLARMVLENDDEKLLEEMLKLHPHLRQLLGHFLATVSYIQIYPNIKINLQDITKIGTYYLTGPIIDQRFYQKDMKRDKLLINFCGHLSPVVNKNQAIDYVLLCLNMFKDAIKQLDKSIKPLIVGNPDIIAELQEHTNIETRGLSHDEMLRTLNSSVAMLVPLSITSIYEALYYETPVIFLPEQHDGHFRNYMKIVEDSTYLIKKGNKIFPAITFASRFPHLKNITEQKVASLYVLVRKMKDGEYALDFNEMKETLTQVILKLNDLQYRAKLVEEQKRFFYNRLEVFKNVANIHGIVESILKI